MFFQNFKTIQELTKQLQLATAANEILKRQLDAAESKNDTATKAYDSLYEENVTLRRRYERIFKEKNALSDQLKAAETESRDLRWELYDTHRDLECTSRRAECLDNLRNAINPYIADKAKQAIQSIPDLTEADAMDELRKQLAAAETLWARFGENEVYLLKACETLIAPGVSLYTLFPEEDCIGIFERDMTEYDEIEWRERHAFGEIVDSLFVGMYEFCTYEIDYDSPAYIAYRIKLYKTAVSLQVKAQPMEVLCAAPEFFFEAPKYMPPVSHD